jgi:hypothetical protein
VWLITFGLFALTASGMASGSWFLLLLLIVFATPVVIPEASAWSVIEITDTAASSDVGDRSPLDRERDRRLSVGKRRWRAATAIGGHDRHGGLIMSDTARRESLTVVRTRRRWRVRFSNSISPPKSTSFTVRRRGARAGTRERS